MGLRCVDKHSRCPLYLINTEATLRLRSIEIDLKTVMVKVDISGPETCFRLGEAVLLHDDKARLLTAVSIRHDARS